MKLIKQRLDFMEQPICIGTGLIALDVIISTLSNMPTQFLAGGSCGNVLTILSYLGWSTFPIARLSNNVATELLLEDLKAWNVNKDLLLIGNTGSTPIIIHRILKDQMGIPKHRFEFRNPENGKYLPSYKPCLAASVPSIVEQKSNPNVFYFDRINRASINLAKVYKNQGAAIFFEPSSIRDSKGFNECLELADVIKFSDDRIPNYDQLFPVAKVSLEIQTLGSLGLRFRTPKKAEWTFLGSYSIDNVIDAAGAGDWCTAGIIMNLFKDSYSVNESNFNQIISALQFGQALSALNCTFEGARGLMYNISKNSLLLNVQNIIASGMESIQQHNKPVITYQHQNDHLNISSLFNSL